MLLLPQDEPDATSKLIETSSEWLGTTKLGMVVYTCNFSIQESEVGRFGVQGQPEFCNETLSKKHKTRKRTMRPLVQTFD